jgi:hypothetical protein
MLEIKSSLRGFGWDFSHDNAEMEILHKLSCEEEVRGAVESLPADSKLLTL